MKKYLLLILIVLACFHEGIDYDDVLDSIVTPNSLNVAHHNHFDEMYELVPIGSNLENSGSTFIIESCLIFPKENYSQIWKPPVIC